MNNTVNRASIGAKKNKNLIKRLWTDSHEKQSPQRFARYAAMLIMLLTLGVGQMWAASVTSDGTKRLYFNKEGQSGWTDASAKLYAYFYNCTSSSSCATNAWSTEAVCSHGTVYYVLIPSGTWQGVILTRHDPNKKSDGTAGTFDKPSWNNKWSQTGDITLEASKTYIKVFSYDSSTATWEAEPPMPYLKGSFDEWGDGYRMLDGTVTLTLAESATFEFKIYGQDGIWYGKSSGTISNTTDPWLNLDLKNSSGGNVTFTAGEAGEYIFKWSSDGYVGVYYPQARLKKNTYVYLDVTNETYWNAAAFEAWFYFKYYDSGSDLPGMPLKCSTPLENNVYYAVVPDNDYVGRIQVERYVSSSQDGRAEPSQAYGRTSSLENCLIEQSEERKDWKDSWIPSWTTYCPIKATSSISDNGTVKTWGGSGTSGSPYYVATGSKIKVSSASTDHISDGNMTTKYDFQVRNASDVQQAHSDGTATTYEYTVPATNDVVYKVRVNSYNYYNSTSSTDKWSTDIYYKARTPYTISYNAGTDGSGSRANETKLKGVNFTLPSSAVFTRAHYTQTGWTTSDLGAQTHSLGGTYSSDAAQEFFPAWTEDEYTVTTSSGTGGSVDEDSYTAYVATTTAISATPEAGYKFHSWEVVSGDVTFADKYSASTTMNATSDAEIKANFVYRWSIAGTWKYYDDTDTEDADAYTMGNIGRNASSKDTCYVEITLAANTNYTFQVVDRSTSPYTWHKNSDDESAPFYMTYGNSTAWTFLSSYTKACGITTAGAGTYKFAYNITDSKVTVTYPTSYTITFGYGTGGSAVTASVEDAGSISSGDYATAGKDITFTKTAANLAYTFKGWYNASSDGEAISYMASDDVYDDIAANISVYAQFKTRYGLHGSLMDNNAGGMPGWESDGADFTVVSYTDIGEGTGKGVDLECSRTLEPNKEYKFRVQDRAAGSRWGLSESAVLPAEAPDNNVKLNVYGDESGKDVYINTVGYGTYTFKITNMYDNGDGKYYPAIEVSRPASSQLTLGWKHYTNDALSEGDTGGTVTAATNEGSGFAITNRQFYANGSNLTFTAAPATGYHVEGWYSDASCETAYVNGSDGATISGGGDVTLELASVSTNKTVYVKFTEDTKEIASGDGNWSAKVDASTLTDVVIISSTITVDVAHALAKRVILDQSGVGKAGKLVVAANKGLEVAEGIWINNGTSLVAPTAEDLVLKSSSSGNATLIFNNSNSAAATVQMYSKSVIADEDTWNWQYIGSPYVSASALHNYYGCYLKKWGDPAVGWNDVANGASVEPWKAYSVTQESAGTFFMDGTLVPTDNTVELDIPDKPSWIVANSWTAPIYIDAMGEAFNEGTEKTVYLFNTGFSPNGASTAETGSEESRYAAGTYLSVPVNSAVSMGNPFISSMQGFVVKNTTDPRKPIKLTLNYSTMVRPTIDRGIAGGMMHAPKNIQEDEQPTVLKMLARGTNYDDCLYLLERADFTTGFDNGWDGSKLGDNAVAPRLYTTREDGTKESVSAVPELEGSILTFRAGEDNVYTFQFEYSEEAETLYLLDLDKNIYTRVLTGSTYTFTTNDKAEHPRFILTRYGAPQITTGVDEVYNANSARKQMINGTLYIIRDGRIYNAEGALVK